MHCRVCLRVVELVCAGLGRIFAPRGKCGINSLLVAGLFYTSEDGICFVTSFHTLLVEDIECCH